MTKITLKKESQKLNQPLVSFIFYVRTPENNLAQTLKNLSKQNDDNYELILIVENGNLSKRKAILRTLNYHKDFFKNRMQLIISDVYQGRSYGYNLALKQARGEYYVFITNNYKFEPNFVKRVTDIITVKKVKPHLVSFRFKNGMFDIFNDLPLPNNNEDLIYLRRTKLMFAGINPLLVNKLFHSSIIIGFDLSFKTGVNYEALFFYHFLIKAKTAMIMEVPVGESLNDNYSMEKRFSDLMNQWPHIFNLFRDNNMYDNYHEAIDFAYFYFFVFFVWFRVMKKLTGNKLSTLHKSIENKLTRRINSFTNNKYVKLCQSEFFKDFLHNFPNF